MTRLRHEVLADGVMVIGTTSIEDARAHLGAGFPAGLLSIAFGRFWGVPETWADSIRFSVRAGQGFPGSFLAVLFRLTPAQLAAWQEAT